jgi:hypothetical protein
MSLSPRDVIHTNDLARYDAFMVELADTQFLDMYLEDNIIKIDVYEYLSNDLAHSASFIPSVSATQNFEQEAQRAAGILEPTTETRLVNGGTQAVHGDRS